MCVAGSRVPAGRIWTPVGTLVIVLAACASAPLYPVVLPPASETLAAPYDRVWDATLRSLGVLRLKVADKAQGRIETEVYSFVFPVTRAPGSRGAGLLAGVDPNPLLLAQAAGGNGRPSQVIWVDLMILVRSVRPDVTEVRVETRVHHALHYGVYPGPTNSPWGDLFAKIRAQLAPPT